VEFTTLIFGMNDKNIRALKIALLLETDADLV